MRNFTIPEELNENQTEESPCQRPPPKVNEKKVQGKDLTTNEIIAQEKKRIQSANSREERKEWYNWVPTKAHILNFHINFMYLYIFRFRIYN